MGLVKESRGFCSQPKAWSKGAHKARKMKNKVMTNPINISRWERVGFLANRKNRIGGLFVMVINTPRRQELQGRNYR